MKTKRDDRSPITNTTAQSERDPLLTMLLTMGEGGIERQEAQGQRELVRQRQRLPVKGMDVAVLEKLGFKVGQVDESDPLWRSVEFPEGWTLKPTDHSMWSELRDDKGRKRASIFYKAAFYDRSAHGHFECRYVATREFQGDGYDTYRFLVRDNATGAAVREWPWKTSPAHDAPRKEVARFYEAKDAEEKEIAEWRLQQYPLADDVTAYW